MIDRTAHNLKVFGSVREDIKTEHSPTSVTCNMNVLMISNEKLKKYFMIVWDMC